MRAPILAGLLLTSLVACGGSKKAPAAPPPLRPTPIAQPAPTTAAPSDCEPADPAKGLPAKIFQQRSIDESRKLALAGVGKLQSAAAKDIDRGTREQLLNEAVESLITALLADPYNVHATYNLAAAYARIGRAQCAVNLLGRLVPLRKLPSQRALVEAKLDRLFGRSEYKGRLDPDFLALRDDPRFRELAKDF